MGEYNNNLIFSISAFNLHQAKQSSCHPDMKFYSKFATVPNNYRLQKQDSYHTAVNGMESNRVFHSFEDIILISYSEKDCFLGYV